MEMNKIIIGVVALLFVFSVVQMVQMGSLKGELTAGSAVTGAVTGILDTSSFTADELMNYEMHGLIPARFQSASAPAQAPTMVGGC